jgi:N-acetylglucosaminyl-diphospho-decaprenol L-rhamnosyltransferase
MTLSIIIVNWNSTDYLRRCLASIYRETKGISIEVVVVDNASRDDSCAELIRGEFQSAILQCNSKNMGFARASNRGYELSSGEILLFLNPDTEIRGDVFTHMVKELKVAPCTGAVGSRLLNSDGSLQTSCVQSYPTILNQLLDSEFLRNRFPTSRLWGMQPLFACTANPARVDVVSGACLMVKREVFAQVGQFDDSYFMYVEDVDLCRRITGAGYTIHYMNDCEVIHHGGKSSAVQGRHFANLRQQQAILQFFAATRGRWYSLLYRVGVAFAAAIRLIIIVGLLPLRIGAHTAAKWKFTLHKWCCIFRWAIGLEA